MCPGQVYSLCWSILNSGAASPKIQSHYANVFVLIVCENNQFLKKWQVKIYIAGLNFRAGYTTDFKYYKTV